jgi:methionyl-tRNA formyltransferase
VKTINKLIIAGKNEIAVKAMVYLLEHYPEFEYFVICNKTDKGVNTWQPSLKLAAKEHLVREVGLAEIYHLEDLLFISLEFDRLIKPKLFRSKALFNIHFSALPAYKGMYTSVHPILNGEDFSGVTLHKIDAGIDTGDIIDQIIIPIGSNTTAGELYRLYLDHAFILFKNNIKSLTGNNYAANKQGKTKSSYFSKNSIDFSNIKIDLNKTAFEMHNQFRAFIFREYQLPEYRGYKICRSEILDTKSTEKPGSLVFEDYSCLVVASIDYNIKLYKDSRDA